jgi:mono/diheme cytochrome c family protein
VTFDEGGTFTFYCNKWCSPNHWRMRGVIAVEDRSAGEPAPQHDPVIENLVAEGIDIDAYLADEKPGVGYITAAHESSAAAVQEPIVQPSAVAGAIQSAALTVPAELEDVEWRRRHTPLEGEALLQAANPGKDRPTLANVIAYLWVGEARPADPGSLQAAAGLYAKNCAACHGDAGDGQGFDAGSALVAPPAFANAQRMAARRGDVLYAKIRRGGMGTGMPNFGTLFTPGETWGLVEYLWRLGFDR